jgi:NADH:ubiquinone oxidoreductase subunit F (NADH-binding)/ferredoxin
MTVVRHIGQPRLTAGLDPPRRFALPEHRGIHPLPPPLSHWQLTELASLVDLRGRGGAAFPFAGKLTAVAEQPARDCGRAVVVNGAEVEPGSAKDRLLLTFAPHLVLDGAILTADAIGASELVVAVGDYQAGQSVLAAIRERRPAQRAQVVQPPARFISGEAGALVRGINGGPPIPPGRKIRATDQGLRQAPTVVSNAETFAQLALLAALGPRRYQEVGTPGEPGTILLTVGARTVVEAPAGTPLADLLQVCGQETGQGVLVGGYHGTWLTPAAATAAEISRAGVAAVGGTLGAGVIAALPPETCPLGEVVRVTEYLSEESAGQCGPCRLGLPSLTHALSELASGRPDAADNISRIARTLPGRGACKHPDGVVRFAVSAVAAFADDIATHARSGCCGRPVHGVLPLPGDDDTTLRLELDWSRCDGHGLCARVAPDLISLDESGYPVLGPEVPAELESRARQAVTMCPALALRLDGTAPPTGSSRRRRSQR